MMLIDWKEPVCYLFDREEGGGEWTSGEGERKELEEEEEKVDEKRKNFWSWT